MRSPSIFTLLASILFFALALLSNPVSSSPTSLSTTSVSPGRPNKKLAKRTWKFLSFGTPFNGAHDADLLPPWYILYNMIYNRDKTVGSEETVLYQFEGTTVTWGNKLDIKKLPKTENVPKSYSFLGMTSDLNHPISAYSSIPAEYQWSRRNGPAGFKGNVVFDFVVSNGPNKVSDHELMLWLEWESGPEGIGPIGTGQPTRRIHNLYGQSWTLYQGINHDINVPVRSLLPDKQYNGKFSGDMKLWLMKLVEARIFKEDAYLFTANMGMEAFWGISTFKATSSLQLLWKGNNNQIGYKPPGFRPPVRGSVVPGYENTR